MMSLDDLQSSLLGFPLRVSRHKRNHGKKPVIVVKAERRKELPMLQPFVQNNKHWMVSTPFGAKCNAFPLGNLGRRNHLIRMNYTKKPVAKTVEFVRSLYPLWKEGLLFIRFSVLFAVFSAAMMFVWYGKLKARSFIEARILPSVCSMLSEYLQREIAFGRVRSISPLSITLESCSIGPHRQEFSCGELPTTKLRVRPFASLRRGKIVIDAVLSRPSILIAQKENFSWLGIPSLSGNDSKRHSASEEGIDQRTKVRRLAREDNAIEWYMGRFEAAKKAAEVGYVVPQGCLSSTLVDDFKSISAPSIESLNSASFFCMDDRLQWRDHHSVDMGMEYVLKHSELEKSFGMNIQGKQLRFWPRMVSGPLKGKFKGEVHRKLMNEAGTAQKQKNLQRSAKATIAHFENIDGGNSDTDSSVQNSNNAEEFTPLDKNEKMSVNHSECLNIIDQQRIDEFVQLFDNENKKDIPEALHQNNFRTCSHFPDIIHGNVSVPSSQQSTDISVQKSCNEKEVILMGKDEKISTNHVDCSNIIGRQRSNELIQFVNNENKEPIIGKFHHNNNTSTSQKECTEFHTEQSDTNNIKDTVEKNNATVSGKLPCDFGTGDTNQENIEVRDDDSRMTSNGSHDQLLEKLEDVSKGKMDKSQESTPKKIAETFVKGKHSVSRWSLNLKLGSQFLDHLKEVLVCYFGCEIEKLKLYLSVKAEDFASEFTEGVGLVCDQGTKKTFPITIDSVYFSDGNLLLLGYGDLEPREMDNVDGHVKFQNHYTRVHVQLSGNCREWKSSDIFKDGGQIWTNVFVDIVDQKWHANLKIENLFAPCFERILELPITWSKGRASGEVHICMSGGETFPSLHGQLDVHDLSFQILGAPSCFSEITGNICFRSQRVFLHNASGKFGDVPLEVSGDFGINPKDGEFHLMCQVMCEAIGRYGWGYVPPTVNRLRGPLLEAEVATFEEMRKKHENKWSMEGCTLMSDGWTDQKGRTIINFLVNSAAGSFYLYSIDASSFEKTAEFIARTLDDAMQNVGIKNVVQICTDNAANYVRAGKILMDKYPHLYWTPCVAHCIDLILEDIGKIPTFKKVITSGRQITSYIYSHSILHSEFLQLSGNKELVRCGVTRFATSFLTLQSLRDNRYHLGKLDWQKWLEVGSGEEVHRNVFARAFWAGVEDCLKASQPLVALLRLVDSDHTPCMGFISQFFDKASSTIDTHFVDKPILLKTLKGILKKRLEKHFNHDLFHAGAFLNPEFYYELKTTRVGFVKALEYEGGFQNCILRMIEDEEEQRVIMEQLTLYKEQKGHFASKLAIQALSNNDPMAWWGSFGITTPQLMIAARRILGLCCTASSCERNWSTFDFVPSVEVNSLMKTLKMKPLLFSLAGSVTAVFNCQGPLDAPVFVGSGIISRKTLNLVSTTLPSPASEAIHKNKEAGAVAAFDHIPFSHVSANCTFNTDNCVADLYGMRANLLDGGEIRGAGNVWICPEGEMDDSAIDVNLSGNMFFDKVIYRYFRNAQLMPLKIGELNGETKLSGSLLKPKFDIKWSAPKAEESFVDARGDIIISHDFITVNSSSVAFDLYTKIQTSYSDDHWQKNSFSGYRKSIPLIVEGVDLDLRMRGFEFSSLFLSNPFDLPRPVHLKATGKIKFQGKVFKPSVFSDERMSGTGNTIPEVVMAENKKNTRLVGDVSLSGLKLNQLMLAPQLSGSLSISQRKVKLDTIGRLDESMLVEVVGPLWPNSDEILQNKPLFSVLLQKGQLKANICYQSDHLVNIEIRNLPLDELELASLRGTIQKAELQLNYQKRRGHGVLSVFRPKFSGVLGEALDVAARWSGDVITIEKAILEQTISHYEIQGEYVLPGTRDRYLSYKERDGFLKKVLDGHLGSVISSMGRWRMRLEVPHAEVAEMLPLARLLSRSIDPAVHSKSKVLFIQSLQAMRFYSESLRELLETVQRNDTLSDDVVIEEIAFPGLAELQGYWQGSLDASGGGDGDTLAEFDFHGEDWEWGSYKTQRVLAVGVYGNNSGLRLDNMFIQKDNATLHADGTVLGPITNLHFAVLNFPVSLVPALAQLIESSTSDLMGSLWQLIAPIKGILHMEGDLRGSLSKPECDVQVRLLDGAVGGIDLGRAEVVASMTSSRRFLFNANFEPITQSGHVHVQGSVPITYIQNDNVEDDNIEKDLENMSTPGWVKENVKSSIDENEKKIARDRTEDGWDAQLAESLRGLDWNLLDQGEVRIDADIKDGGMALLTALCPYASWIHGYADVNLQVRGTVELPVVDGSASFHRASISSPVLQKPLTNLGATINVKSNRLCIISMESRVSRKGRLVINGNLPLKASESFTGDKISLKCEIIEVQAKNVFSGQVDSQMQIMGSILQPNISGRIKLSHGEAYLPHDKGNDDAINRLASKRSSFANSGFSRSTNPGHLARLFGSESPSSNGRLHKHSGEQDELEKTMEKITNSGVDVRLTDLRIILGPELRIMYPLILNFAASGELELNGMAHHKLIRPKGLLTFENGNVNLVATQVRLKRDHLNVAKFEPELGLDPMLDLALVGSEWQFRIQSPASRWQDNLVVTSTRSVDQDVLSPTEAAKVFENQLAESLLETDGKLAFKKLATATLETLMPRIEGKGEFGHARWRLVYAPQIPNFLSVDPTVDPLKSLANNISLGTEVEVQLGKRLQASVVRQMKDSELAMQWTLVYQLTSRLRVLFQSSPSTRLLFEYSAISQN